MTISNLVEKKDELDSAISHASAIINSVNDNFKKIAKFEQTADKSGKEAVELARASVNALIMDLDKSRALLRNYSSLLDDIMRQTEIPWPPRSI